LEKLQDRAPSVSFDLIRQQLEEDFGAPPEDLFAELDPQPIAAASMAQVHRATLFDGTLVIIKVRRPGIRPIVEADLRLLARLAAITESELPDMRRYKPKELIRQFTLSLRAEMDLATECRNAERIARNFTDNDDIVIPQVYWEWVGERVNVQEYIDGIPGRDLAAVGTAGLDRKVLAQRGAHAVLKMMLEDGFFHADPHQGNIYYLADNRLAFIDFGMVGRLPDHRRHQVVNLLHGLADQNPVLVVDVLLDWAGDTQVDVDALTNEISAFVDQYHGVPLRDLVTGSFTESAARSCVANQGVYYP